MTGDVTVERRPMDSRPDDARHTQLRQQLDRVTRRGTTVLGRWHLRRDLRESGRRAPLWLLVGPVTLVMAQTALPVASLPVPPSPWWIGVALALCGPLLFVVARVAWRRTHRRIPRQAALALFDRQLACHERLLTADAFLHDAASTAEEDEGAGTTPTGAFRQAAIDDAAPFIARAVATTLEPRPLPLWHVDRRTWLSVPAAAGLIALVSWIGSSTSHDGAPVDPPVVRADSGDVDELPSTHLRQRHGALQPPRVQARDARRSDPGEPVARAAASSKTDAHPARDDTPAADVEPRAGHPSPDARSSTNARSASGEPADQQDPSRQRERPDEVERLDRDTAQAATKPAARKPQRPGQATSPTSGAGQSTPASSSPSHIPSQDQPDRTGAEKEPGDDTRDVQDQEEEEKTTGTERPSLRRNKPPVNRNLSPFPNGDEPNPLVNGRSGGGEQKKTRGVPSMILGMPIPDRVPGTKNPGRSKVTRERSTPTEERPAPAEAEPRLARMAPFGHVEHPPLLPWMQRVIERYFLDLREQTTPER